MAAIGEAHFSESDDKNSGCASSRCAVAAFPIVYPPAYPVTGDRLKKLLAESMLENEITLEVLRKNSHRAA